LFLLHLYYNLSCSHTEPESTKDCSSNYCSRLSTSEQQHSQQQEPSAHTDRLTQRCDPGSGSSNRRSVLQRLGYRKDDVSSLAHDADPCRRSGKNQHEERSQEQIEQIKMYHKDMVKRRGRRLVEEQSHKQAGRSLTKVDHKDKRQDGSQLTEDLEQLSVVASGDGSSDREEESGSIQSQYKSVLMRHVNQLFVRGDNVALVAILD